MLTDYIPYDIGSDSATFGESAEAAVVAAKELFGENDPYIVERFLGGKVIIFNIHFITTVREAMTTGCMAKMNTAEENLFTKFIRYQEGSVYRDITQGEDEVMEALDAWLVRGVGCQTQPVVNGCFDKPTHTWNTCGEE